MIPLQMPLSDIRGIAPRFLRNFSKLGIFTVKDLLWHFPVRYEDFSEIFPIAELEPGQRGTIQGVIQNIKIRKSFRRRMVIVEADIGDDSGTIKATWFNQPYLLNILRPGRRANFSGKVTLGDDELRLSHPIYELINARTYADDTQTDVENFPYSSALCPRKSAFKHTGRLVPIYPETRGLTSKGIRFLVQPLLKTVEPVPEWLPKEILKTAGLPEINHALRAAHFPETMSSALRAKKRFAFEELFLLQLLNIRQKLQLAREQAPAIKTDIEWLKRILAGLPFKLTHSQKKSLWEIIQDLGKPHPMNRLLQGDVGSGKTAVAALAALIAHHNGLQTVFMAPTEILARQHFETLKKLFRGVGAAEQPAIGILTSSSAEIVFENDLEADISKTGFKKKTKTGEIGIVVGTHALIQKDVAFRNFGLAIVDEQHRFGVAQRQALLRNSNDSNTLESLEDKDDAKIVYKELSYKINGFVFQVQRELGRYAREKQYGDSLEQKLKAAGTEYIRESSIVVAGRKSNVSDFIIEKKLLLELKAKPFITKDDYEQVMRYLKSAHLHLGLLINFRQEYLKPKRILNPEFQFETFEWNSRYSSRAFSPHLLSMSATPIPRTLMLTVFGNLDISTITELPAGRRNIITKIVAPESRTKAYQFISEQIKRGRQAFVICPRIQAETRNSNDSNTLKLLEQNKGEMFETFEWNSRYSSRELETKAVKEEYENLSKKVFPNLRVEMLHGRLKPKEKAKIMSDFAGGKTDILVSTSVVEVGVDVPNATIMLIEGSERFGLAQLYQLRGRVGRGQHQSFCFLFTDSSAKMTTDRLKAILEAKNGFELAEKDLKIRGPGEFIGQKQTGLPDVAMAGLQDIELIKQSRTAALKLIQADSNLKRHPLLAEKLDEFKKKIHPE